jgi:colicin import membrane protein
MEKAPIEKAAPKEEAAEEETPAPVEAVKPEISVSESKPKPKKKTALKYKTFKSKRVLKSALEKIEKEVERTPTQNLQDTIKQIREKVAEEEKTSAGNGNSDSDASSKGKSGGYAHGSKQESELIDLYRGEIAYSINANWAFSEQLANRNQKLMASLVFKVMPDGHIEDIFFVDRSGNQYLDDSAMKAVMKSSPVKSHPSELNRPYVELGLRFTPEGVH